MSALYLVNEKTKKRFRVLRVDREKGTILLQGGLVEKPFEDTYDVKRFKALGYTLKQE